MQYRLMRWMGLMGICLSGALQAGPIENMFSSWWNADRTAPQMVKVLVVHDQPGAVLEVKGKYKIYDPNTDSFLSTRFLGKRKFIQTLSGGLKWGEEFPGMHQLKIVPDDVRTATLIDGVEYKGSLYIYDIGGSISIVNEIPVEEYLKQLLVPQFDQKIPYEAAAAVAIAARTNTWYSMQNSPSQFFAVDAAQVGYHGVTTDLPDNGIAAAINETRNMILVKNGAVFPAEWGSAAGGSNGVERPTFSRITIYDAEKLASRGDHAAQILAQAFPESSVTFIEKTMTQ